MNLKNIKLLMILSILLLLILYLLSTNKKSNIKLINESFQCVPRGTIIDNLNCFCKKRKDCRLNSDCRWLESRNPFQGDISLPNKITRDWCDIFKKPHLNPKSPPGNTPSHWDEVLTEDDGIPKKSGCPYSKSNKNKNKNLGQSNDELYHDLGQDDYSYCEDLELGPPVPTKTPKVDECPLDLNIN